MKNTLLFFILLIANHVFANDGAYYTRGGSIFPMQETKISMDAENLSFKVADGIAEVHIRFEFFNPEDQARTLKVGFQAPSAVGDVLDSLSNSVEIKDFTIMQNGNILPYEIKIANCEDCELKNLGELEFNQGSPGVFVFLFEITFQPGNNILQHSYKFPKSSNVEFDASYAYILTTGSKWAGNTIKDFTLNIDMGANQYFYVQDIFGAAADWSINGTGRVTDKYFSFGAIKSRMVRTINGTLQIKIKNFRPTENIEFGVIDSYCFVNYILNYRDVTNETIVSFQHQYINPDASKEELRLLRNSIYAQHSYAFSSADLRDYFERFEWYMPDPNLRMSDIQLSADEQELLRKVQELEAQ